MLHDVVEARVVEGYRVYVRFDDGAAGEVDLSRPSAGRPAGPRRLADPPKPRPGVHAYFCGCIRA
jgi:hypothetical protein